MSGSDWCWKEDGSGLARVPAKSQFLSQANPSSQVIVNLYQLYRLHRSRFTHGGCLPWGIREQIFSYSVEFSTCQNSPTRYHKECVDAIALPCRELSRTGLFDSSQNRKWWIFSAVLVSVLVHSTANAPEMNVCLIYCRNEKLLGIFELAFLAKINCCSKLVKFSGTCDARAAVTHRCR